MSTQPYYWARLAPYDPRRGRLARKFGIDDVIYRGGDRPVWYKVSLERARKLMPLKQPQGGQMAPPLFEIYDDARRRHVDRVEDERALVALGIRAATAEPVLSPPVDMDLTDSVQPQAMPGRAAAFPKAPEVPAALSGTDLIAEQEPAEVLGMVAEPPVVPSPPADDATEGTLTTADLPGRRRRR